MQRKDIQLIYKVSELASFDIDSIIDYTTINFGVDAMIKYHASLEQCFETLANNPKIGQQSDFILEKYYRFNHQSYVIFYQILNTEILIVRVLHKSMDVDNHLK